MKNYEDIAERVFKKGDAILEKKHRRTEFIKRTSFAVSGLCAVIIAGLGLWNNHSLKNAMDYDYPAVIDSQDVSENDIPVITQTTAFVTEKNNVTLSVTVSTSNTTGSPAVFYSATTAPDDLFTDNNISVATASEEISSVPTDTHSEDLQETTQTTISTSEKTTTKTSKTTTSTSEKTTAKTSKATTTNTIKQTTAKTTTQTTISTETQTYTSVTETTITSQDIYYERSLKMKKLSSFATALAMSLSAVPVISNASTVDFSVNPSRYWSGEDTIFAEMESGELDVDINGNGEFDIMDCYLLDSYCSQYYSYKENIDPEIIQRIESIADYNRDGEVNFDDTLSLMRYFIVDGNIRMEYLDPAYYDPDIAPLISEEQLINFTEYKEIPAYCFPMRMYYHVMYLQAEYYLMDELYQNGTIDFDINGNGELDIDDVYCMEVYCRRPNSEETQQYFYEILTEEEIERCNTFFYYLSEHLVPYHYNRMWFEDKVASYILNHIEIKPEYFTLEYCKNNIEDYEAYYNLPLTMRNGAKLIGIQVSDNTGPAVDIENDRQIYLDMDIFNPFYDTFCSEIENGTRPAPDVNMDGAVDYIDYFDMNIYWSDIASGITAEHSILPVEVWNNIDQNYGVHDDIPTLYELTAGQFYIMEHTEEIADSGSAYQAHIESLIRAKEDDFDSINYDENISVFDEERSGDANEDGKVTLADAVLIMQSLSNPNEYKLTTKGAYNADVCNTGDGVTPKDALQIQMWTLEEKQPINT
ncbi:MAG: hypothetical protein NC177_04780 [Ruminococcus flavefaciens]|nr:hypothetical protein [Ruminococcus flavefaciens]